MRAPHTGNYTYPLEGTVSYCSSTGYCTPCLVEIVDKLYSRGLLSISLVFEYTGEDESATVRNAWPNFHSVGIAIGFDAMSVHPAQVL